MRAAQQSAARAIEWLEEGRRVAAGLLVGVDGSAPLDVGASMYVDADGAIEGSVTGGCVESAVAQEALALLAGGGPPRLVTYGISDELAGTVGLMCGGTVHVFVHELRPDAHEAVLRGLRALVEERPSAVATLLDGPAAGAKLYVDAHTRCGSLGGPDLLDRNVEREARGLVAHGRTTVRRFGEDGTTLGTGLRVQVTTHAEPPRMVIFGAIDFSAALAKIAAGLGYRVTIADPRARLPRLPALRRLRRDRGGVAGRGAGAHAARPARRRPGLHPRREARRPRADGGVRVRRRLHRRARQPADDDGPGGAAARRGRHGRRPRAHVRAVRARRRRGDGGGDGDRRPGGDDRPPRAPLRRLAARLERPDPAPEPGGARARDADARRAGLRRPRVAASRPGPSPIR